MVEYFSSVEDKILALAVDRLERFAQERRGYEPRLEQRLTAMGGAEIRVHLRAIPQHESAPTVTYLQWMADKCGLGRCSLMIAGETGSHLRLDFHEPIEELEVRFCAWLSRVLAQ